MLGPTNAHDSNGSHEPDRAPAEPVEQRLRRLEDAVAALQDTAVMEDRLVATFEHDAIFSEHRLKFLCTRSLGDEAADFFIMLPVGILCPGIELPVRDGDGPAGIREEHRPIIPRPGSVGDHPKASAL